MYRNDFDLAEQYMHMACRWGTSSPYSRVIDSDSDGDSDSDSDGSLSLRV